MLHIERATDMPLVRALFMEYASSLPVDLSFQDFDRELDTLPGHYDPILLALVDREPVGCVAIRPIDSETCEMKRLFVRPGCRGLGVGRALAEAAIAAARSSGFHRMRLDTLPTMREAIALYESFGFRDIPPYRHNPVSGARYMELDLTTK